MATALLVALCAGFYSCGGGNDETPLNNDDNSNISNEMVIVLLWELLLWCS